METSNQRVEGVYFVDTLAPESFQERFRARFREEPLLEPYNGYEAVRALAEAWKLSPGTPELAMSSVKYHGITGTIDFTSSCAGNQSKWHLKQFDKKKIVVLD